MQASLDQYRDKCFYLEEDLGNKIKEIDLMKADIERFEIEQLGGTGGGGSGVSLAALRIESEQLRKDNARLLALLSKTKEYQNFGNFVEDSGGNAIRLPKKDEEPKLQDEEWIPGEAFATAQ